MWTFSLERTRRRALHEQIADQLRDRIETGYLPPGTRLPATRELARVAGVGRNTVTAAYETLLIEGLVESEVGRGTFVSQNDGRREHRLSENANRLELGASDRALGAPGSRPPPGELRRRCDPPRRAGPGSAHLPDRRCAQTLRGGAASKRRERPQLRPLRGYGPLRETIALRVAEQGGRALPDDVLIVTGSQAGLDLVARLLLEPGDTVVVGAPTYSNALRVWQLYGARIAAVPLDSRGMRPGALEAALEQTRAKLIYVMPTFQNPTGLSMDEQRSREIVAVAGRFGVPVLEDHFDTELRYRGRPIPPLRAYDQRDQVLLLGTLSKVLFPGFRIGWLVVPPAAFERVVGIRRTCELSPALLPQMVASELIRRGLFDRHLARVRQELSGRLDAVLDAADRHLPPEAELTRPEGAWRSGSASPRVSTPKSCSQPAGPEACCFAPGPWFFADGSGRGHLRLTFGSESAERLQDGIRILGAEIERLAGSGKEPVAAPLDSAPFL